MRVKKFKNYSGFVVYGREDIMDHLYIVPDYEENHLERAFLVTFLVECGGLFGTVMNYDGTGMTAGPCQNILVYPRHLRDSSVKNDQGPLCKLLREIELIGGIDGLKSLFDLFREHRIYLAQDGKFRWSCDIDEVHGGEAYDFFAGDLVPGNILRAVVMQEKTGNVPSDSKRRNIAEKFVLLFHRIFSDRKTFSLQKSFEIQKFIDYSRRQTIRTKKGKTIEGVLYSDINRTTIHDLGQELDLAMNLFWCFLFNAPSKAKVVLSKAINKSDGLDKKDLAKNIIIDFATNNFAHWNWRVKNGRYERFRTAAKTLDLWEDSLFADDGICPRRFLS